jgi:hypothetical protein
LDCCPWRLRPNGRQVSVRNVRLAVLSAPWTSPSAPSCFVTDWLARRDFAGVVANQGSIPGGRMMIEVVPYAYRRATLTLAKFEPRTSASGEFPYGICGCEPVIFRSTSTCVSNRSTCFSRAARMSSTRWRIFSAPDFMVVELVLMSSR